MHLPGLWGRGQSPLHGAHVFFCEGNAAVLASPKALPMQTVGIRASRSGLLPVFPMQTVGIRTSPKECEALHPTRNTTLRGSSDGDHEWWQHSQEIRGKTYTRCRGVEKDKDHSVEKQQLWARLPWGEGRAKEKAATASRKERALDGSRGQGHTDCPSQRRTMLVSWRMCSGRDTDQPKMTTWLQIY